MNTVIITIIIIIIFIINLLRLPSLEIMVSSLESTGSTPSGTTLKFPIGFKNRFSKMMTLMMNFKP